MPKNPSQEQFARLVGVSQPDVSMLMRKGILTRGVTIHQWLREYLQNLRAQAAGHKSSDGLDLIAERARLAARQSEKLEIESAKLRADLIPKDVVTQILNFHNTTIRSRLLAIPNRLKGQRPEITTPAVLALKNLVLETLVELSHVRLPRDIDERTRQYFLDLHASAKPNGDGVG